MTEFIEQTNKVSDNIFAAINSNRNSVSNALVANDSLEEHQYLNLYSKYILIH